MSDIFIERPLLPVNDVTVCAVSEEACDTIKCLEERGIRVLRVRRAGSLPDAICSHADLQVLPLGGSLIAVNEEQTDLIAQLEEIGFRVMKTGGFGKEYPHDCVLNLLPLKSFLIGKRSVMPRQILSLGIFEPVDVAQGYSRCSSVLLDEDAVLTDDPSIGKTVLNFAKFSIMLKQKEIVLKGYDHGFIGGSCGKISEKEIAFCGQIPDTPFGRALKEALAGRGFSFCELGSSQLTDTGGIVPLMQRG